jgi:hypothetical protein
VFGEDALQEYTKAVQIEAYIENVDSFKGDGDVFANFGYAIHDQINFQIAQRRWKEVNQPYLITETGYNIALENTDDLVPGAYNSIELDLPVADQYLIEQSRPYENDLIWFPLVQKMFVIRFVEHEEMFYPLGRLMVYQLRCELYEASSENIDTDIPEIDAVETETSFDVGDSLLLMESGVDELLNESGGTIIVETYRIENVTPTANNELFQVGAPSIVDFSEFNPFAGSRVY